jgi:four helix bundle protein
MTIQSHEDLLVWQRSMALAVDVDRLASAFPVYERYGLAAQIRRAAESIPANIAEGWPRPTRVYINHLSIALGSEAELKTQLQLAVVRGLISNVDAGPVVDSASQVGRMLRGLRRSLQAHLLRTQP